MVGSRRAPIGVLVLGVVLLLACTACQDWAQFGGGPALNGDDSGETVIGLANAAQLSPTLTIALPNGSTVVSTPVEVGATIYAGTSDGHLVAASPGAANCPGTPKVCQPLWTASLPGLNQASVPTVSGGIVYDTFLSTTVHAGELAAFDAAGSTNCSGTPKICQPLWTATVASVTSPNVDDHTVFVADAFTSSVLTFDATGTTDCAGLPKVCTPEWTDPTPARLEPTVAGGQVFVVRYVSSSQPGPAVVDVYDEAGVTNCSGSPKVCQPVWTLALPGAGNTSVAVANGMGFLQTASSSTVLGDQVAFATDGVTNCAGVPVVCQPRWTAQGNGLVSAYQSAPAVAGGRAYSAGSSGLLAFDATASTCTGLPSTCSLWFGDDSSAGLPTPVVTNGLVVAGNKIYDAAGVVGCTTTGQPRPVCSPVVTLPVSGASGAAIYNGSLFLGGSDGFIHVFRVPGT